MKWLLLACFLVVVGVVTAIVWPKEVLPAHWEHAKVEGLGYTPGHTVTGVGPSMSGNGGIAITSGYISSTHTVIFSLESGEKWTVDDESWWRQLHQGQSVDLQFHAWRYKRTKDWTWELDAMAYKKGS